MITYTLVLVDKAKEARRLNALYRERTTDTFRIEAVGVGEVVHGRRHGAQRPNMLIDMIQEVPQGYPHFEEWYAMVRRALSHDAIYM
jgi:hypothetical protein